MISDRAIVCRTNIPSTAMLHTSEVTDIALELSGNMSFGRSVESVPSHIECLAIGETHKDVCIIKTPIIINITINRTVCIICENFGHRHSCVLCNVNHVLGFNDVDVRAKLDNDLWRNLHYSAAMAEDQIASILAVFVDCIGMWQAEPRSRVLHIQPRPGIRSRRRGVVCHRRSCDTLVESQLWSVVSMRGIAAQKEKDVNP